MSKIRKTGKDVRITLGAITGHFRTIAITFTREKYTARSSDSLVQQRGTKFMDAKIEIGGWDSDHATGASAADVLQLIIDNEPLSALDFTDDSDTPVDQLPADFWDLFPLDTWGLDEVKVGDFGDDPASWTIPLSPNNLDMAAA